MTTGVQDERRPAAEGVSGRASTAGSGLGRLVGIAASLVSTQAATSLLGLVYWTLAARLFLVQDVGVAGAAVATMTLLGSIGSLGLGTLLISRLPHTAQGERRVLVRTSLFVVGAAGAGLGLAVPLALVHLFGTENLRPLVGTPLAAAGLALGTGLMAVVLVLDQAVLTLGSGNLQLERNILASVIKIVALVALNALGAGGGMAIFLAWTIGSSLSLPLVAFRTRGGRSLQDAGALVQPARLRGLARTAASHHALNLSLQAPLLLLPIIVTVSLSAQDNGYFNSAVLVTGFVFALPYAIAISLFASADGDAGAVIERMSRTIPFGLAASALAYVVLYPSANLVLRLFGQAYAAEATTILRVIVLAGIAFVVKDHFIALRRVQGRTTQAVAVTGVFLVVELVAAVAGARLGGTVGLCVAWVAVLYVEAFVLAVPLVRSWRAHRRSRERRLEADADESGTATTTLSRGWTADAAGAAHGTLVSRSAPAPTSTPAVPGAATDTAAPQDAGRSRWRWLSAVGPSSGPPLRPGRNLVGPVVLLMSLGVLVMALAAAAARGGQPDGALSTAWMLGLALVYAPAAARIVASRTPAVERIALALALPVVLQVSRLVLNPTRFAFHDELIHQNTLRQIDESSRLFTFNPLLPVSGYYPGLEVVTDAVHQVTGLSPFVAGTVVLVLARVVLALGLLGLVTVVVGSTRAGAIAVLVYVLNSQFLFFNSQFSYQTLALPLAVLAVYLFLTRPRGRRCSLLLPLATVAAVALTHHVTSMLLALALAVWLVVELVLSRNRPRNDVLGLAVLTAGSVASIGVLALNPGSPVRSYLDAIALSSSQQITALTDGAAPKTAFSNSAGVGPQPVEQVLLLAAVVLVLVSLVGAVVHARTSWRRRESMGLVLALAALLYPLIPAGHLTQATAEVGDRAAGFVFLGTGAVMGWWLWRRTVRWRAATVVTVLATVTFLGNIVLGSGPTAVQLPGPYLISADSRSVDADNVAAASWLAANVPAETRVYSDRVGGLLDAAVGGQFTVRHVSTNIDASRLILDPEFTQADVDLIRSAGLAYLVVDRRLANGLPNQDVYIENGEFNQDRTTPVSLSALTKFDDVPQVTRVYDNGSVAIYDLREILDGS